MSIHEYYDYFEIGPILFIKLKGISTFENIKFAREDIEKFRVKQKSEMVYIADLTEWEFTTPEATVFMKANQEHDINQGNMSTIILSTSNLIKNLFEFAILKNIKEEYHIVSNMNEVFDKLDELGFESKKFAVEYNKLYLKND